MTDPKKRLEEIFFNYHIRGCKLSDKKSNEICNISKEDDIKTILKEFVHKDNLPKKIDIVTVIVDELVRYRTDERFKFNARMSGKNWTMANWLAKAIRKLIVRRPKCINK